MVYAIAPPSGARLTPGNFFTFSQVALYRAARRLRLDDVEVEVVTIPSS